MINKIFSFFSNSIKGRMMLNVAVIHAVIMGAIIYDLNNRQEEFMQTEQAKKGVEIASILASNAADAMLRNDIVAMEELVFDVSSVKNADMVFLLDNNGRVRASNDKSYFNLVLNDGRSKELIDRAIQKTANGAQIIHDHLVDTVYPISVRGETIGYARILLSNKQLEAELSKLFHSTLVYALLAIVAGSFLAYLMIRQMSRDIDALSEAAKRISRKDFDTPVPIIKGKSEIANMAEAFSVMAASIRQNIDELQKSEQQMKWQATHDHLTGLNNREGFEKMLTILMAESRTLHTAQALLFLNLDKFKVVNDTAGYLAGDELLINIAKLIQNNIRQNDLLFRFGGDEFGILLRDCDTVYASIIGQKIIDAVDAYEFRWEKNIFRVGVSIGIVQIDDTSSNAVEVLSLADTACYTAKENGRNRIFLAAQND